MKSLLPRIDNIQFNSVVKCPKCSFAFAPDMNDNNHTWRDIRKADKIRWNKLTPEEQQEEQQEELRLEGEAGF